MLSLAQFTKLVHGGQTARTDGRSNFPPYISENCVRQTDTFYRKPEGIYRASVLFRKSRVFVCLTPFVLGFSLFLCCETVESFSPF